MNVLSRDRALAQYRAPTAWDGEDAQPLQLCLLCGSVGPPIVRPESCCSTCGSPLAPPPTPDGRTLEHLGRRGALRRGRDNVAMVQVGWPSTPLPVRWRDLSLTGLSLHSERPIDVGQTIRVSDPGIDVVAQVVDCRHLGRYHTVHARLLRARFLQTSGVFISARA
jgi:hypothetical protein